MKSSLKPSVGIPIPVDYFEREPLWGNAGGYRAVAEIVDAVEKAGGEAHLLFPEGQVTDLDALVLPGGGDVDPAFYGQTPLPEVKDLDRALDDFQMTWARRAFHSGMPVLGICRGMQLMNVAAGGSLIQHIPNAESHFPEFARKDASLRSRPIHAVRLARHSRLQKILEVDSVEVNSLHHQAVGTLSPMFCASAWSDDGLVEAIERPDAWQVGVQFHPEDLRRSDPRFERLFESLVGEASGRLRA